MAIFGLLLTTWFWAVPDLHYGPRPMVAPVISASGEQLLYVRESWRGDELHWLSLNKKDAQRKSAVLWSEKGLVIDAAYWAGEQASLLQGHFPGFAPSLWWLEWDKNATGLNSSEVKVRSLTPSRWPEGSRQGARVVTVHPDGHILLSLDRRRPYQPDLFSWSPSRSQPRVVEVNSGQVLQWKVDAQGTPRLRQSFQVLKDSVEYRWEWRQQAYGAWTQLDTWHLDEPAWRPLRFAAPDQLWVYAETEQRDTFGLHSLGLLAGAIGTARVSSSTADMARVWWSASQSVPAMVEWDSLIPAQRALLPEWRQWQRQLQHKDDSAHWLLRQVKESQHQALVTRIDGRQAQSWWHYDLESQDLQVLGQAWPEMNHKPPTFPAGEQRLPELQAFRWTSEDGLPLSAYFQPALSVDKTPPPLLVLVHGGPWARDRYQYDPLTIALAKQGIAVLKVNFRGSSGLGKDFLLASRGAWGQAMQRDLIEGMAQVAQRGWANIENSCIAGMSYGGYAALQAVLSQPHRFRCALAHAPVTDLASHIRQLAKRGNVLGAAEWRALVGDPDTQVDVLKAVSPLHQAGRLTRPVLLSHGEKDGVVEPWQSLQFLAAAPPLWLKWRSVNGGHALETVAQRQQLWNHWQRFLQQYLLSDLQTAAL